MAKHPIQVIIATDIPETPHLKPADVTEALQEARAACKRGTIVGDKGHVAPVAPPPPPATLSILARVAWRALGEFAQVTFMRVVATFVHDVLFIPP